MPALNLFDGLYGNLCLFAFVFFLAYRAPENYYRNKCGAERDNGAEKNETERSFIGELKRKKIAESIFESVEGKSVKLSEICGKTERTSEKVRNKRDCRGYDRNTEKPFFIDLVGCELKSIIN